MVLGDFLWLAVTTPVLLVIGYFVWPHWKGFDPMTKFVMGLIPTLVAWSWAMMLLGLAIRFDPY